MSKPLKCSIEVIAGIIPGQAMSEFIRTWHFTSDDMEGDARVYLDGQGAAMNYMMVLQNPQRVNWVRMQWVWY